MTETRKLLECQAAGQKRRAPLTWPEKVRMVEAVRDSAAQLSRARSSMTIGVSTWRRPGTGEVATRQPKDDN